MLKEIKNEYDGGAGVLIVDVSETGGVVVSNTYSKDIDGLVKVSSETKVETSVFAILERIAAKTSTTWDDKAIAGVKSLLGIK